MRASQVSFLFLALLSLAGCAHSSSKHGSDAGPTTAKAEVGPQADTAAGANQAGTVAGASGKGLDHIAPSPLPPLQQSWVELGEDGQWLVRAVTIQKTCPDAKLDGRPLMLQRRTGVTKGDQEILVCEATLDSGSHRRVVVMGQPHDVGRKAIKKIAILGDTGCRIKAHGERLDLQNCNSSAAWPLQKILNDLILPLHPDLIVHVGDYHYRETECPPGNRLCAGSIAGDNVESWQQDFFLPASRALNQANWLFVRGNHEICNRAGESWFRFLDPRTYPIKCSDATDPVVSQLGGVTLVSLDAADEHNIQPSLELLAKRSPHLPRNSLLFQHRPFLTPGADDEAKVQSHLPDSMIKRHDLAAVITGHKHIFSFNEFNDGRPFEIITGNGGTKLMEPGSKVQVTDHWSHTRSPSGDTSTYWEHGFLTLDREAQGWLASEHDVDGNVIFTHHIPAR